MRGRDKDVRYISLFYFYFCLIAIFWLYLARVQTLDKIMVFSRQLLLMYKSTRYLYFYDQIALTF